MESVSVQAEKPISSHHSSHSVLREKIVEHVFVADVLRRLWQRNVMDVEVLRSEFDAGGYDLALSFRKITRHVQLKSILVGGKRREVGISLNLAAKPSGCVVWIVVTPDLAVDSYLWFGNGPGEPLPDISIYGTTRHTKGDAGGTKNERPNLRDVPRTRFTSVPDMDGILHRLFGPLD